MVHVTTGNKLDVVYEVAPNGRKVIKGLWWQAGDKLIPLPEPDGLLIALKSVLNGKKENTNAYTQGK